MDKPIIVAVDDQKAICDLIASMLNDKYEVITFTEGKLAVEYMQNNKIDLALLDYEMPEMTGYQVMMGMHARGRNANVPTIFLTRVTNQRMKDEMVERGATDYVCKPIDFEILQRTIKKCLNTVK